MARTTANAEDSAIRTKAFELWTELDGFGKPPTVKQIAITLGVSQPRVNYWMKADRWIERSRVLAAEIPNPTIENLKDQLRHDLSKHLVTLSGIIDGGAHERTRVTAIVEYAKIAKQLGALELPPSTKQTGVENLSFEDEIDPDDIKKEY